MKFREQKPAREFQAGYENKCTIRDCGSLELAPDEQVTFRTENGGELDVTRKEWGFYATPSLNKRLPEHGLKAVLVKNRDDRYFVLLVETGKEALFEAYAKKEPLTVVSWMYQTSDLAKF